MPISMNCFRLPLRPEASQTPVDLKKIGRSQAPNLVYPPKGTLKNNEAPPIVYSKSL